MVRRLYALGSVNAPETAPEGRNGSAHHPCLESVWSHTLGAQRLWYAPTQAGRMNGPPGSAFGLYALKYAVHGTECEGMDQRINHVASLDQCFQGKGVDIHKVTGCGPVRLLLLTNGVLVTMSEKDSWHGVVVPSPDKSAFIVDAAAGEGHYLLCDSDGAVWTWGWNNEFGQFGRGSVAAADRALIGVHEPRSLPGFGRKATLPTNAVNDDGTPRSVFEGRPAPKIVAVACGRHHSVLLTESRTTVYTFGRGTRGQLGLGRPTGDVPSLLQCVEIQPVPRCVPRVFGAPVREVHCANDGDFTICFLKTGEMVVWGDNTTGGFGLGTSKAVLTPTVVHISEMDANSNVNSNAPNSVAGSSVDAARSMRTGPLDPRRIKKLVPPVKAGQPSLFGAFVAKASVSLTHSALVDRDGRLLTAGLRPIRVARNALPVNAVGALGRRPKSKEDALTFGMVDGILVDIDDRVVCGEGYTAYLMKRQGLIFLVGAIAVEGRIIVGGGEEAHDLFCIPTGIGRRTANISAVCGGGLLMVVDDV
jgi:hypothetical protein